MKNKVACHQEGTKGDGLREFKARTDEHQKQRCRKCRIYISHGNGIPFFCVLGIFELGERLRAVRNLPWGLCALQGKC